MSTCLIATTKDRLIRNSRSFQWRIEPLDGTRNDSAFVVLRTLDHESNLIPTLWVKVRYSNYHSAFKKYLISYFNCDIARIPHSLQVDHLHSRHRFKAEHKPYYIRLALIEREINSSFGAGFERRFYSKEREKIPQGGYHMDWFSFLKIYGIKPPSVRCTEVELSAWCWSLAKRIHLDRISDQVLAYHGISTLLNLGFSGQYRPYELSHSHYIEAKQFPGFHCVDLQQAEPVN